MKVELHLHTTRYSGCATCSPEELMPALIGKGYQAVFITEHDALWSRQELQILQSEFPDIRIFPGVELSLGPDRTEHLLVLGTYDRQYLTIRDPAGVLQKARAEGRLTVLAHPFRWKGGNQMLDEALLPDAIEQQTCNQGLPEHVQLSRQAAARLHLPLVNAGDVHAMDKVGRFWIETRRPVVKAGDIRAIILEGQYENRSAE